MSTLQIDSLPKFQVQLLDMLEHVAAVLSAHNVRFFLAAGTALGAVRDGDMIAWDSDVDLLVCIEDYERARTALSTELPRRYVLTGPETDPAYEHLFSRVHLDSIHHKYAHVDLFPLVGTWNQRWQQEIHLRASLLLRKLFYGARRGRQEAWRRQRRHRFEQQLWLMSHLIPSRLILSLFMRLATVKPYAKARYRTNLAAGYLTRECVPARLYDVAATSSIRGRSYPVPDPPEEYLRALYADFKAPPSQERQQTEYAHFESWFLPALKNCELRTDETDGM